MDNYVGEIKAFAFNFVPYGWIPCDGRPLLVQQYTVLYVVLGNLYQPAGVPVNQTSFYVPDLRGVVPIGFNPAGPLNAIQGQKGGEETVTLSQTQIPAHNHNIQAEIFNHTPNPSQLTAQPGNAVYFTNASYTETVGTTTTVKSIFTYAASSSPETQMNANLLGSTGSGGSHENRMPYMPMTFAVCAEGMYPSRP
jgi:microcystin-dependent protein